MPSAVRQRLRPRGPPIVVAYGSSDDQAAASDWARSLGLPCVGPGAAGEADLALVVEGGALWLRDYRGRGLRPLRVDLEVPPAPRSRKALLGRAVGRRTRTVVDATAGWGDDLRRLCAMGYAVTAVERHPVMAALLEDAVSRARRSGRTGIPERIVCEDAIEFLTAHPAGWDCVYLDPMFPPKRRTSALARRPLRLLRELAGDDPDRQRLYEAARVAAGRRVVAKRPEYSRPLFGKPDETAAGKLVCYDVYHVHRPPGS